MKIAARAPKSVGRVLIVMLVGLSILHVVSVLIGDLSGVSWLRSVGALFDLDNEMSAPAIYSSILLGSSALFALILASQVRGAIKRFVWGILSLGLFFLAIDESLSIHERMAEPIRRILSIGYESIFFHAWVIVALLASAVGVLVLILTWRLRLVTAQQATIFKLLLVLVVLDVVLETVGTRFYASNLIYKLGPVMAEELFETGMMSLILYRFVGFVSAKSS